MRVLLTLLIALTHADTPPGRLADRIQEAWGNVKTYKATFKQVIFSKGMGTRDESTGTVYVAKPGKLRWESATDNTTQILTTNELYVIKPNRRRGTVTVDIWKDLKKAIDMKPIEFLSGKAKLKEIYQLEIVSEAGESVEVKLIPKHLSGENLSARFDKKDLHLVALISDSPESRTITELSGTQLNVAIDPKLFEYKRDPKHVIHEN